MKFPWFERRPLFGKEVLITRSREQAGEFQLLLEAQGARVAILPLLEILPPDDWTELDRNLARLDRFHWVIFTSSKSVDFFFERLHHRGQDTRALGGTRVAAVGLATAERLRNRGIHPDLIPEKQSQEGLAEAFASVSMEGRHILFPASAISRTFLAAELEKRGARVAHVVVYQNRPPDPDQVELPSALRENRLDLVVFASPSSVDHFRAVLGAESADQILSRTAIAAIGPTTAGALTDLGLEVAIQPQESSIPALVQAICTYFSEPCP